MLRRNAIIADGSRRVAMVAFIRQHPAELRALAQALCAVSLVADGVPSLDATAIAAQARLDADREAGAEAARLAHEQAREVERRRRQEAARARRAKRAPARRRFAPA